jgi:hypothetical protein
MPKVPARLLGQPIAVVVLAAAVAIGAFSGVGYAATRGSSPTPAATASAKASPTIAPLVWHPLKLMNGWVSAASWGTGPPAYAVSAEGVVYFEGSLRAGNSNDAAFVMPVGTRPGYYDCFSIYSNASNNQQTVGALHIYANGKAYVQGPSAQFFDSLTGTSYVVGH